MRYTIIMLYAIGSDGIHKVDESYVRSTDAGKCRNVYIFFCDKKQRVKTFVSRAAVRIRRAIRMITRFGRDPVEKWLKTQTV